MTAPRDTAAAAAAELAELGLCGYAVKLPNGDSAEAVDADSIVRAAQVLVADASRAGAASSKLRAGLFVTVAGRYDATLTARARS